MSTPLFETDDGHDPNWGLTVETSCNGLKLFIMGKKERTGAKFWFRDRAHVEELREALDWIGLHHFGEGRLETTPE